MTIPFQAFPGFFAAKNEVMIILFPLAGKLILPPGGVRSTTGAAM
jgi:hypothetical protein